MQFSLSDHQMSSEGSDHTAILQIAAELLNGVEGLDERSTALFVRDTMGLLRYSIKQMAHELNVYMGFSMEFAELTARQIAPKPLFYSLLIKIRTAGTAAFGDSQLSPEARYEMLYHQLAPEFTVYLFDQNIDNYNTNHHEDNIVERVIHHAAKRLHNEPYWYLTRLEQLIGLCFEFIPEATEWAALPEELRAFGLLVPYIRDFKAAGATYEEIFNVLYTISDVITNEHLAQLAYAEGEYAQHKFTRYNNFTEYVSGIFDLYSPDSPKDDAELTLARALLRAEGHFLVSANHYLQHIIKDRLHEKESHRRLADLLRQQPELISLIRFVELIVRTADDVGDLGIDIETSAPNIFIATPKVQADFLQLSGIRAISTKAAEYVTLALHDRPDLREELLNMLSETETNVYQQLMDNVDAPHDLVVLVNIIQSVIWGAKINGLYNDRVAEAIGNYAVKADTAAKP